MRLQLDKVVQLVHLLRLDGVRDIYVRLHRLVVGVPRPLHHDVDGDSGGQRIADEGAAGGVGGEKLVFLFHLIRTFPAMIGCQADLLVETGQLTELFQVVVHLLVADDRQRLVVGKGDVFVLLEDAFRDVVQVDDQAVRRLLRGDLDAVVLDVAPPEVIGVRVPEAGEAAEHEDVAHALQGGPGRGNLRCEQPLDLIDCQEDDLLLRGGEVRLVTLEVHDVMVLVHGRPLEKPLEIAELLEDRRVGESLLLKEDADEGGDPPVGEVLEPGLLLVGLDMLLQRVELLNGRILPGVLLALGDLERRHRLPEPGHLPEFLVGPPALHPPEIGLLQFLPGRDVVCDFELLEGLVDFITRPVQEGVDVGGLLLLPVGGVLLDALGYGVPHDQVHAVAGQDLQAPRLVADADPDGQVLDNLLTFVLPRLQRDMDVSLDVHLGPNLCAVGPTFRPEISIAKI